jgi:hypothetical protein
LNSLEKIIPQQMEILESPTQCGKIDIFLSGVAGLFSVAISIFLHGAPAATETEPSGDGYAARNGR